MERSRKPNLLQLENLHERTDTHILVMAVRSSIGQYNAPYVFYTDDRISDFLSIKTGGSALHDLALQMEGYIVSGMKCEYPRALYTHFFAVLASTHTRVARARPRPTRTRIPISRPSI